MSFDSVISRITSDGHVPVAIMIFVVGAVLQWFHHLDGSFVAFTTTVLTFLGGHAWITNQNNGQGK